MLCRFREKGLLKTPKKQRTDSSHVLAAIRILNRLEVVGETLRYALNSIATVAPLWLRQIKAVEILRRVWLQQYLVQNGSIQLREASNLPPSDQMIRLTYDPDARYGNKRSHTWIGYKVHIA